MDGRITSRSSTFLLNVVHIFVDGLFDSVPILLSFMIISFGAGEKDAGIIVSLATMLGTLAGLSTKFFSQKFGFAGALACIVLLYAAGFFANTFSQHLLFSGTFFIVAMAGQGLFHNLAFAWLTMHTQRASLGKTMGDFTAIGDIGRIPIASFAGFAAAYTIAGMPGWRFVCLLYGVVGLCFAGYLFLTAARARGLTTPSAAPDGAGQRRFPSFALLRKRHISLAVGANVLDAFSGDQIFLFLPFLLFAKGFDPKVIGGFALAFTVGCFVGKMACGRMVGVFGTRRVFVASKLSMAGLLVAAVVAQELSVIIGASMLLGIVTKGTVPVLQTIVVEDVEATDGYEDIFSINTFFRGVTNIITPLLFGWISSLFSVECSYALMAVFSVAAVGPVVLMHKRPVS